MNDRTCFVCSGALSVRGEVATCASPICAGGARFALCGVCEQWSDPVSGPSRGCWNDACTASPHRPRCPSCSLASLAMVGPARVCTYLECPTHQGRLVECFACRRSSRLKAGEGRLCVAADCRVAWTWLVACPACTGLAFDPLGPACRAVGCKLAAKEGVVPEIDPCPACGRTSLLRSDTTGEWTCVGRGCAHREATLGSEGELARGLHALLRTCAQATRDAERLAGPDPARAASPFATTRLPRPAAPSVPPPAPAFMAAPVPAAPREASLDDALDFLLHVLADEPRAPVQVLLGLPGSGKTTFLAMLGELLRRGTEGGVIAQRFALEPALAAARRRAGAGGARWTAAGLAPKVRDLIHDFARAIYVTSLARMQWPRATRRDEAWFLIAELLRGGRPSGRLVTIDAPGEESQALLRALAPGAARGAPSVLARLLDQASGVTILVDPTHERNDDAYLPLFLALDEALAPRARNALRRAVRDRQGRATESVARIDLERDREHRLDAWHRRVAERRAELHASLLGLRSALLSAHGFAGLQEPELARLKEVERLVRAARPDPLRAAEDELARAARERGDQGPLGAFYRGLVDFALSEEGEVVDELAIALVGPPPAADARAAVLEDFLRAAGVRSDAVTLGALGTLETLGDREEREGSFPLLRHVSLVVTKTDVVPAVHPPAPFLEQRLPRSWPLVRSVETHLRLLGGALRLYNASATGHSILHDGRLVPGKESTLTPINVVEPFLDPLFAELGP